MGRRPDRDRADPRRGNLALTSLGAPVVAVLLAIAAIAAGGLWAILRDDRRGFVAALLAALLVAPFTLMYAASILLLAVGRPSPSRRCATRVLALIANPAVLVGVHPVDAGRPRRPCRAAARGRRDATA